MRADARRNCELLIATAREVFTEKGAEAPLDEIAKRAGVGAGTLYRHFPTREALVEAVYRGEVDAWPTGPPTARRVPGPRGTGPLDAGTGAVRQPPARAGR